MDELFDTLKLSRASTHDEIRTAFLEWKKSQQEILKHGSREEKSRASENITRISSLYKKFTSQSESNISFSQPRISLNKTDHIKDLKLQNSNPVPNQNPNQIQSNPVPNPIQSNQSNPYKIATIFFAVSSIIGIVAFFLNSNSQTKIDLPKEPVEVSQKLVAPQKSIDSSKSVKTQQSVETPKVIEEKIDPNPGTTKDQRDAVQSLFDFHSNITQKNFQSAYNCLSPDFQNVLSFEGWAAGFKTTVSSSVSNVKIVSTSNDKIVLSYDLRAVDNPGGVSNFKGTVILIKTSIGWKIDEIINKVGN